MKLNKGEVRRKTGCRCGYCGKQLSSKETTIDHIIPKSKFFSVVSSGNAPLFLTHLKWYDVHHIDNLLACCSECNRLKRVMSIERFRKLYFGDNAGSFFFEKNHLVSE